MDRGSAVCAFVMGAMAAGCGGDPVAVHPDADLPVVPTFHADVAPILNARCQACHQEGGIAPFPLVTFAETTEVAPLLRSAVATGVMPPWGASATADCAPRLPWKDELSLGEDEVLTLVRWVDRGMPEGTPPATPLVPPSPVALSRVDVDVGFAQQFLVEGVGDLNVCFPLDMQLQPGTWIEGVRVVPGNRRVVHHVNVHADPTRNSLAARRPDGTVPCDYTGVEQKHGITFWVPGIHPIELPNDMGIYLPDGANLVVEVHYHPTLEPELDDTHVQLAVTTTAPRWAVGTGVAIGTFTSGATLLPDETDPPSGPELFIPAGVTAHTETLEFTVPSVAITGAPLPVLWVTAVNSHMHLLGKQARVEIERPGGKECVLHEEYDYRWQRYYEFDAPLADLPTIAPGDVIRVRCTYDNSIGNPALVAALEQAGLDQPIDVYGGWQMLDEMCQTSFVLAYEWTGVSIF